VVGQQLLQLPVSFFRPACVLTVHPNRILGLLNIRIQRVHIATLLHVPMQGLPVESQCAVFSRNNILLCHPLRRDCQVAIIALFLLINNSR
jgi:hypothetical protein